MLYGGPSSLVHCSRPTTPRSAPLTTYQVTFRPSYLVHPSLTHPTNTPHSPPHSFSTTTHLPYPSTTLSPCPQTPRRGCAQPKPASHAQSAKSSATVRTPALTASASLAQSASTRRQRSAGPQKDPPHAAVTRNERSTRLLLLLRPLPRLKGKEGVLRPSKTVVTTTTAAATMGARRRRMAASTKNLLHHHQRITTSSTRNTTHHRRARRRPRSMTLSAWRITPSSTLPQRQGSTTTSLAILACSPTPRLWSLRTPTRPTPTTLSTPTRTPTLTRTLTLTRTPTRHRRRRMQAHPLPPTCTRPGRAT